MGSERLVHSTKRDDYCTPVEVLDRVREVGPIDLDPCPSHNHALHFAERNYCSCDDCMIGDHRTNGLDLTWSCSPGKVIFVNPPYGGRDKRICGWINKCEINSAQSIIALMPASTGSEWFEIIWRSARCVCFVRRRLRFVSPDNGEQLGSATFWSAIPCWGPESARFASAFRDFGKVVWL